MRTIRSGVSYFDLEQIDEVSRLLRQALERDTLTAGPLCDEFECLLRDFVLTRNAVVVNNGTSALIAALLAAGVGPGDEVLVQANTFVASAAAVLAVGGSVVFVDSDESNLGPTLSMLEQGVGDRTRGFIATHLGGLISPDIPQLAEFCRQRSLVFIEDAAQALGSRLDGAKAGAWSDAAIFSFYQRKVATTGEGGAVTTSADGMAGRLRLIRDQGRDVHGVHSLVGLNLRMTELQAALGIVQMKKLSIILDRRRRIFAAYSRALDDWAPRVPGQCELNGYKFWLRLPTELGRAEFTRKMMAYGIALPGPLSGHETGAHLQPAFRDCRMAGSMESTDLFARQHACLPLYPSLSDDEVDFIVEVAGNILSEI
jgi:dTDP-4-amino-4,6-dideoxygalactose transaminase